MGHVPRRGGSKTFEPGLNKPIRMDSLVPGPPPVQNDDFDQLSNNCRRTKRRLQLLENGYEPLPAIGKEVHLKDWNKVKIDQTEIQSWAKRNSWANTSLRCHKLAAIDVDVDDQLLANAIVAMTRIEFGNSPFERIGQAPRTMLVYRAGSDNIRKRVVKFRYKNTLHKIEVLGRGQQFVASGIHPGTRKKYKWAGVLR